MDIDIPDLRYQYEVTREEFYIMLSKHNYYRNSYSGATAYFIQSSFRNYQLGTVVEGRYFICRDKLSQDQKEQRMKDKSKRMFKLLNESLTFDERPIDEWQTEVEDIVGYIEDNSKSIF